MSLVIRTAFVTVLVALAGCVAEGNGQSSTRDAPAGRFERLAVGSGIQLEWTVGAPSEVVTLTGDENLLAEVEVVNEADGTLRIHARSPFVRFSASDPVVARLSATALESIALSGGSVLRTAGPVAGEALSLVATDTSVAHIADVAVERLSVELSNESYAAIGGTADTVDFKASRLSLLESPELTARVLRVDLSGKSIASLTVTEAVSGRTTGQSFLDLEGDPSYDVLDSDGLTYGDAE